MKTAEDILEIFDKALRSNGAWAVAIADAWNADVTRTQELNADLALFLQKARRQLRKVRSELARARKLCDYYSSEISTREWVERTLRALIERIAKGNK